METITLELTPEQAHILYMLVADALCQLLEDWGESDDSEWWLEAGGEDLFVSRPALKQLAVTLEPAAVKPAS